MILPPIVPIDGHPTASAQHVDTPATLLAGAGKTDTVGPVHIAQLSEQCTGILGALRIDPRSDVRAHILSLASMTIIRAMTIDSTTANITTLVCVSCGQYGHTDSAIENQRPPQ